jgi:hypothetical protein
MDIDYFTGKTTNHAVYNISRVSMMWDSERFLQGFCLVQDAE